MKKGAGTPENKEMAFRVYALFGGKNIQHILERLRCRNALEISAQTLYEWKREGNWDERMKATPAEPEFLSFNERMLRRLMEVIERYERRFDKEAGDQAAYAYANLVRVALELSGRMHSWEKDVPDIQDKK